MCDDGDGQRVHMSPHHADQSPLPTPPPSPRTRNSVDSSVHDELSGVIAHTGQTRPPPEGPSQTMMLTCFQGESKGPPWRQSAAHTEGGSLTNRITEMPSRSRREVNGHWRGKRRVHLSRVDRRMNRKDRARTHVHSFNLQVDQEVWQLERLQESKTLARALQGGIIDP